MVPIAREAVDRELAQDLAAGREPRLSAVCEAAYRLAEQDRGDAAHFKVATRRSDRAFGLKSPEISMAVGRAVHERLGLPGRMTDPDFLINVLVLKEHILVFTGKEKAFGGLPAGSSGRAMVLLSGGIDSPVAAWLMMRRGVVPFEMRSIGVVPDSHDMVMFRRFMFMSAAKLARRQSCRALISGDSLGQVASQTIHNLGAIAPDLHLPVLRPLIGMDKMEITAWSKVIGAFPTSILPYRDCCSIRSPKPVLTARAQDLLRLSGEMDLKGAVNEALETAVCRVVD